MSSLHYNGSNSLLLVNTVKMYQFKAEDSKVKPYRFRFCNELKHLTISNMKKTKLKGYVHAFSVNYKIINTNDILDIHK